MTEQRHLLSGPSDSRGCGEGCRGGSSPKLKKGGGVIWRVGVRTIIKSKLAKGERKFLGLYSREMWVSMHAFGMQSS